MLGPEPAEISNSVPQKMGHRAHELYIMTLPVVGCSLFLISPFDFATSKAKTRNEKFISKWSILASPQKNVTGHCTAQVKLLTDQLGKLFAG